MVIHMRTWIGSEEFDEYPIVAIRSCRERIERRQLLIELQLLLHGEVPTAHLVVETRAACIHHQGAFCSERGFEGQMDRIGASGNFSDRSYRSMQHDGVASRDAQFAKVIR